MWNNMVANYTGLWNSVPERILADLDGVDDTVEAVAGLLHRSELTARDLRDLQELLLIPAQNENVYSGKKKKRICCFILCKCIGKICISWDIQ